MPLAISIFPIWCVLANPMHCTKIDMFIGDIFIITSAIITSTMDIEGVHTNNIAIMLIIQYLVPNILMHSYSNTLAQFSFPSYSQKILKR